MCQVLFWALAIQLWKAKVDPTPITSYILQGTTPTIVTFLYYISFTLHTILLASACIHIITPILEGNTPLT